MQNEKRSATFVLVLTIFALDLLVTGARAAAQTLPDSLLYSFLGGTDGSEPSGNLTLYQGNLYGTTVQGGDNFGTVFELTKSKSGGWTKNPVWTFAGGADGSGPSGLIHDSDGNLYGTTESGGKYGDGTVFELSLVDGVWTKTILHSFGATKDDGQNPYGGLALSGGDLYGTTASGGTQPNCGGGSATSGCGTLFELKAKAGGGWTYKGHLYSFGGTGDGQIPNGVIVYEGNLYGTTEGGGKYGDGTVFELAPPTAAVKYWTEPQLYSFEGFNNSDGAVPSGGLAVDASGNLWGTTSQGGVNLNNGIVFKLTPGWTYSVILSFPGSEGVYPDGLFPVGVVFDKSSGNFYGTMEEAGGTDVYGTLYELTQTGGVTVLHYFAGSAGDDGAFPSSGLILDGKGNLYGTTSQGGGSNYGTVFKLTP